MNDANKGMLELFNEMARMRDENHLLRAENGRLEEKLTLMQGSHLVKGANVTTSVPLDMGQMTSGTDRKGLAQAIWEAVKQLAMTTIRQANIEGRAHASVDEYSLGLQLRWDFVPSAWLITTGMDPAIVKQLVRL